MMNKTNVVLNRKENKVMNKKKKGFTLIELIVVIAILGILAMIAIPKLSGIQRTASIRADISTATTIVNAAKSQVANANITTDAALVAINIATLTGANLIDAPGNTRTTNTAFVLTITGTVANPVYTVTDGTNQILPTPSATYTP